MQSAPVVPSVSDPSWVDIGLERGMIAPKAESEYSRHA
jgi:hypothetical protein